MPGEDTIAPPQVTVPELPTTDPAYNSFIQDVLTGGFLPGELEARLRPDAQGYATAPNGTRVAYFTPGQGTYPPNEQGRKVATELTTGVTSTEVSLREERIVGSEQADIIRGVATSKERLAKEETGLQSTASFLEDVLADSFLPGELEARLRPDAQGYATAPNGTRVAYFTPGQGTYPPNEQGRKVATELTTGVTSTEVSLREERIVGSEQADIIRGVATSKERLAKEETGLQSTASFLEDVLADSFLPGELEARLRPDAQGYATAPNGTRVAYFTPGQGTYPPNEQGRKVATELTTGVTSTEVSLREERIVGSEQADIIRGVAERAENREAQLRSGDAIELAKEIIGSGVGNNSMLERARAAGYDDLTVASLQTLSETKGQSVDPDADRLVQEFLETGNDTTLLSYVEDRRAKLADVSDTGAMRQDIGSLETYVQAARQVSVRSRFWKAAKFGTGGGQWYRYRAARGVPHTRRIPASI